VLVENHQVKHGYRLPDRLRALVLDGTTFSVEVRIQNDQLTYVCACPQEEGEALCTHVLAFVEGWTPEPEKFPQARRNWKRGGLKKYSNARTGGYYPRTWRTGWMQPEVS